MSLIIRRTPPSGLWNLHTHSTYSYQDALPSVEQLVDLAYQYKQPAMGLTDHGNMAGSVRLYQTATELGLKPFPGSELYVVRDRADKKAKRHHMCVVAFTTEGYENLVRLSTLTHKNFHNKPLIDHIDLAQLAEDGALRGIAATSGCYFGYIAQHVVKGEDDEARSLIGAYSRWFDRFYVELQNHNIDHGDGWNDSRLADRLHELAVEMGVPAVLTQDSHYALPLDKPAHETLKRLVAFGPEEDDAVFPGDGFHLADDAWFQAHHSGARYEYGREGLVDLLDAHDLSIRELDHYSYNIPFTVADPQQALTERCFSLLRIGQPGGLGLAYQNRLVEELEVIKDTGMAGYLILVAEVVDWCKANQVFCQARGSASGSIVCWLLGITQADPIKYKMSFERFISRDRNKPPDIDLDIEHDRRQDLIEWLNERFSALQIGTFQEFKLHEEDDEGEGKGSLKVKYFSRRKAMGLERLEWKDIPQADKDDLYKLASYSSFSHTGTHAAGLVVTTTPEEIHRSIPSMWNVNSSIFVTQYDMDDVEAVGKVKLDILGLKTLTVLHRAMDNLGRDVFAGLDWIPGTDSKTFSTISAGKTDGVFQLEGWAARRGCRDLKPSKVNDVIAAMALFRPATMNSGATAQYIERRHKRQEIPKRHKMLDEITKETYGIFLYQEQVITLLRELGMDANNLTKFLKAVKASQQAQMVTAAKTIEGYRTMVEEAATQIGISSEDFHWLWAAVTGFAAYGFNQAHSTAYGLMAYRCAYLATHFPLEFYAAILNVAAGSKKEAAYVTAARSAGIRILPADVNKSDISYSVDPNRHGIRRGLVAVKGVASPTATEIISKRPEGGYESLTQMAELVNRTRITGCNAWLKDKDHGVGIINKLAEAGALESLGIVT